MWRVIVFVCIPWQVFRLPVVGKRLKRLVYWLDNRVVSAKCWYYSTFVLSWRDQTVDGSKRIARLGTFGFVVLRMPDGRACLRFVFKCESMDDLRAQADRIYGQEMAGWCRCQTKSVLAKLARQWRAVYEADCSATGVPRSQARCAKDRLDVLAEVDSDFVLETLER